MTPVAGYGSLLWNSYADVMWEAHVVDLTQHASFLTAIARVLAERDLLDLFGISTTNIRKISLRPDELMVETTDSERRKLTITPVHRSDLKVDELTETFWTFIPDLWSTSEGSSSAPGSTARDTAIVTA